jgi:hypothetical protein
MCWRKPKTINTAKQKIRPDSPLHEQSGFNTENPHPGHESFFFTQIGVLPLIADCIANIATKKRVTFTNNLPLWEIIMGLSISIYLQKRFGVSDRHQWMIQSRNTGGRVEQFLSLVNCRLMLKNVSQIAKKIKRRLIISRKLLNLAILLLCTGWYVATKTDSRSRKTDCRCQHSKTTNTCVQFTNAHISF